MNVLIHVGYPKCASTYLQKTVFPKLGNYSNLAFAPRDEKYYPLRRDFDPDEFHRLVKKHTINPDSSRNHLILSCEDWAELLFKEFEEVFFQFNGLNRSTHVFSNEVIFNNLKMAYPQANILFIIREPVDYVLSRYKMLYRGAKTDKSIDAFFNSPTEGYDQAIERSQKLFGKKSIHVIPFELLKEDSKVFVKKVTELIDVNADIPVSGKRENAAPNLRSSVELERLKKNWRIRLEKKGRTATARLFYLIIRTWLTWFVLPKLKKKYGNEPFNVQIPPGTPGQFSDSNKRIEKLTGLNLHDYGYTVD